MLRQTPRVQDAAPVRRGKTPPRSPPSARGPAALLCRHRAVSVFLLGATGSRLTLYYFLVLRLDKNTLRCLSRGLSSKAHVSMVMADGCGTGVGQPLQESYSPLLPLSSPSNQLAESPLAPLAPLQSLPQNCRVK